MLKKTSAITLIDLERCRQVNSEQFDDAHDDKHDNDQLALAAAVYTMPANARGRCAEFATPTYAGISSISNLLWPFERDWFKPTPNDRIRELVKAGALIVAEIERLQRVDYANWLSELRQARLDMWGNEWKPDPEAWRPYYDDDYTPLSALQEDMSYGG